MDFRKALIATRGRTITLCSVGIALVLGTAACGASPGTQAGLEKTTVTVGALPVVDFAALWVAQEQGLFSREGLTVKLEVLPGGSAAVPKLAGGGLDFAMMNYVSAIQATESGTVPLKIVQDAYQIKPDAAGVLVPSDSRIHRPADLKGKKIAINTKANVGQLLVTAGLQTYGVKPTTIDFRAIDFPKMVGALQAHKIDAVWTVEPFVTEIEEQLGGRLILDSAKGPTADFPIGAYITTATFARRHPKTTAAFRNAIARASQLIASNRSLVEKTLPTYAKIDPKTASLIHVSTFSGSVNQQRGQQVADLMTQYGFLRKHFDIKPML